MYNAKFYKGRECFEDAYSIREKVFMNEQGFSGEIDDWDDSCTHCVIYHEEKPIACGRYFSEKEGQITIGRIAVLQEYRMHQLGSRVMSEIEKRAIFEGYTHFTLSAQCQAMGFYEKMGYKSYGETYLDEHCPHIRMEKKMHLNSLEIARNEINKIDSLMAKLFEERMNAVHQVINYKLLNNLDVLDTNREEEVINRNLGYIKNEEFKEYYVEYIKMQMELSKKYQKNSIKKTL